MVRYGDVYWCSLPTYNDFILDKNRPCLIISNDFQNQGSSTVQVCPLTTSMKRMDLPCHVHTHCGVVRTEQILTIDKDTVGRRMGTLSDAELRQVKTSLMVQLGIL